MANYHETTIGFAPLDPKAKSVAKTLPDGSTSTLTTQDSNHHLLKVTDTHGASIEVQDSKERIGITRSDGHGHSDSVELGKHGGQPDAVDALRTAAEAAIKTGMVDLLKTALDVVYSPNPVLPHSAPNKPQGRGH